MTRPPNEDARASGEPREHVAAPGGATASLAASAGASSTARRAASAIDPREPSPIVAIYEASRAPSASWVPTIGRPSDAGWIAGDDLRTASSGPLHELLQRIGERSKTSDRRTIAASFALRYGFASAMAIGPYLRFGVVPDVSLENVSLKFRETTFLERTALHEPRGAMAAGDPRASHPSIAVVSDAAALLRVLRATLVTQAAPVVAALYDWSGFAPRGTWGMLTSSWASHFTTLGEPTDDQRPLLPRLDALFGGDDVIATMRPRLHDVTCDGVTQLFQRRTSCCRWYLLPQGSLCTSCPLVSQEERLRKNEAFMRGQQERARAGSSEAPRRGHA